MLRRRLEHLKIETRLIDERFSSVMGERVIVTLKMRRLHFTTKRQLFLPLIVSV
jgi:hypothetical protein